VAKFSGTGPATTNIASLVGWVSTQFRRTHATCHTHAHAHARAHPAPHATPSTLPLPKRYVDLLYSREVDVNLQVSSLRLFTDPANEPFSGSTIDALFDSFTNHWASVSASGVDPQAPAAQALRWRPGSSSNI
jgi:hypothetical protein